MSLRHQSFLHHLLRLHYLARESYEHHASILIFAQIFARRFSLTIAELRLDPGGVLAPLLDPDTRILRQDQLSASASEAVGTWILRLLDEMEHGREVLTKYTPELTNKIMPTIFDQCLSAFTAGIIEWKSIERLIVRAL